MANEYVDVQEQESYRGATDIRICHLQVLVGPADIARDFCKQLGIATAMPDGEDSAGRSQLRLLTPTEVVQRACEMADVFWNEARTRGWMVDLPTPKPQQPRETAPATK